MRIQAGAGIAAFRVRPRLACGPYLLRWRLRSPGFWRDAEGRSRDSV